MNSRNITIRESTDAEEAEIRDLVRIAFRQEDETRLVSDLLHDDSARPVLSLSAVHEDKIVGHILFSRVYFEEMPESPMMHILAPLAVAPDFQGMGVGGSLIRKGIESLRTMGSQIVFVLGHKAYYPRFGFIPDAAASGYEAPYPIPEVHADAWMYQCLDKGAHVHEKGKIRCADSLNRPEYWVE